jgi:CDP-diacylglycerol--glycerol-3-phosphate 3-phosphatidyltransferase
MHMNDLTDNDFVTAFLAGTLPPTQFHHREHLRLAWYLIRRSGGEEATRIVADGIRRFATRHGQADKYHETLTLFWVRIVRHLIDRQPDIVAFEEFLAAFPQLLDKALPSQHWSHETMQGQAARAHWVEPDLLALPA